LLIFVAKAATNRRKLGVVLLIEG